VRERLARHVTARRLELDQLGSEVEPLDDPL
jgi:hypothetical protein